ncbi:PhnD/SsuA/transferrin family substrate-binding protein [Thiobacter aerophilum]|uniref:PhnD/SsuA/transferrin family substrate-binding protein n=1 Tax=Thiobacter aerophilum TaxID=3121275 RepID=A0ABV0EGP0_9BURK
MQNPNLHPMPRILFALVLLAAAALCRAADREPLYLGSVAMDTPAEMVRRLTPLADYLGRRTGLRVEFRASPDLGSAVQELGRNLTQIAYLTPVAYLEAREQYNAQPLVAPLTRGKTTFHLVIATRADSPYRRTTDLRGKRFAFGDPKALLQRAVVVESGIRLEEFSSYAFLKHYDNIAKAVLNQDFDAGILKDTVYEQYEPHGLRRLYTSPPLPSYLFAVSERLPPATVAKLKAAFLELKASNPQHKAILRELDAGYEGFEPVEDRDYDLIRRMTAPFRTQ